MPKEKMTPPITKKQINAIMAKIRKDKKRLRCTYVYLANIYGYREVTFRQKRSKSGKWYIQDYKKIVESVK